MPVENQTETRRSRNALDTELTSLVEWMQSQDQGLGQSAETSAAKSATR